MGEEVKAGPTTPKVYFSCAKLEDKTVVLKGGYNVKFVTQVDDQDRQYAAQVSLTSKGVEMAATREAANAESKKKQSEDRKESEEAKAEKAGNGRRRRKGKKAEGNEENVEKKEKKEKKERQPRPPRPAKNLKFSVTCEGKAETKEVEFDTNQSLGKLKRILTAEFETPSTYLIYVGSTSNDLLTNAVLRQMEAGASLYFAPAKESSEES